MSTNRITRHFASITMGRWGARQVHYRRAGSGPVVIMFHQSPLSSRDMLAAMERWKTHFTCIAPDSPGFGLSDPLAVASADMRDFADAAIEFMDALGIERAAVYGFHTGAMISAAIAPTTTSRDFRGSRIGASRRSPTSSPARCNTATVSAIAALWARATCSG